MNGKMPLPLNPGQRFEVYGGPYRLRPARMKGVRMAKEIDLPADVVIPTEDYNVPDVTDMAVGLNKAVTMLLKGQPLYVGCMGGIGRTGLFMAILAKAFGIKDPVRHVRATYLPHAVETTQQKRYVAEFNVPLWVTRKIAIARFLYRFSGKKLLTRQ